MTAQNIDSFIEKIYQHPLDMPAMTRFEYAVGLVGIALQDGYAGEELKNAIFRYVAILRRNVLNAETHEIVQKLHRRVLLCGDMLCALTELERNATMDIVTDKDIVSDEDSAVNHNVETVVDNHTNIDEDNLIGEFVFIHDSESHAVLSETDSDASKSDWEIL